MFFPVISQNQTVTLFAYTNLFCSCIKEQKKKKHRNNHQPIGGELW